MLRRGDRFNLTPKLDRPPGPISPCPAEVRRLAVSETERGAPRVSAFQTLMNAMPRTRSDPPAPAAEVVLDGYRLVAWPLTAPDEASEHEPAWYGLEIRVQTDAD